MKDTAKPESKSPFFSGFTHSHQGSKIRSSLHGYISGNKYIALIFIFSTAFFLYQHYSNLSWDFSVNVLNAKYMAGEGNYFEHQKPPLMPFALSILSPAGWVISEYLYIIIVSALFLYSSMRLAGSLKTRKDVFYLFLLSPYVLFYSFINGTEMLSLALLELFIAFLLEKKSHAGIFLGLATLARYNFMFFTPLLFRKDAKKLFFSIAFFILPLVPWLIYNFYATGNFLTSFADSYALNVKFRQDAVQPVSYSHILLVILFLTPLFLYGLYKTLHRWAIYKSLRYFLEKEKNNLLVFAVFVLLLYQYYTTPLKDIRYLFPMVLPVAYFSSLGLSGMRKKSTAVFFLAFVVLTTVLSLSVLAKFVVADGVPVRYEERDQYVEAIDALEQLGISDCRLMSDAWPALNYLGKTAEPLPRKQLLQSSIGSGNFILIFYSVNDPEWAKDTAFIRQQPVAYETEKFILLGNKGCNPARSVDRTYLSWLHENVLLARNLSINTNPCFILFDGSVLEQACNFLGTRGFVLDENRYDGIKPLP